MLCYAMYRVLAFREDQEFPGMVCTYEMPHAGLMPEFFLLSAAARAHLLAGVIVVIARAQTNLHRHA